MSDQKKVGRPAGSLNKVAVNKTKLLSEAITIERLKKYIDRLDEMMMDGSMPPSDFIKALQLMLRYSVLTPGDILEAEVVKEIGSKEEADKIFAALRKKITGVNNVTN
ncbi:MAG: hypothetical protein ACRDCE_01460 [Cetobacterium sp.]|uniref:hypothetical protein n=1 Tax=Cetobacterium sp. TaxID=2071632 RepID=UPI003EE64B05